MRPPAGRGGPPRIVYFYLAVIVVTWAANWPMMKLALGDAPPLVFVLLRLIGTIVLLAPALRAMRVPLLPIPGERLGLFWVGQLQVAAFLVFAILGLSIEAAGRAIVLAYTFSLWAIPIGLLLGVERLRRFHLIGTDQQAQILARLEKSDTPVGFFAALRDLVYEAYYTHPRIQKRLGYDFRSGRRRTAPLQPFDEQRVSGVRQMTPFYRKVPS